MKGFIYNIDDSHAVHSAIVALSSHGVQPENASIVDAAADIQQNVTKGDVIVVNSIRDLLTPGSSIVDTLIAIMEAGVSLVILQDPNLILTGETGVLLFLKMLKSQPDLSLTPRFIGNSRPRVGRPFGSVSAAQQSKYEEVLRIYESGESMRRAVSIVGCNYSSFWYWYKKNDRKVG